MICLHIILVRRDNVRMNIRFSKSIFINFILLKTRSTQAFVKGMRDINMKI